MPQSNFMTFMDRSTNAEFSPNQNHKKNG